MYVYRKNLRGMYSRFLSRSAILMDCGTYLEQNKNGKQFKTCQLFVQHLHTNVSYVRYSRTGDYKFTERYEFNLSLIKTSRH